jgi:non-specific protein-tyrosine kinase
MDIAIYLRFIRKWAWLIVLAAVIAGGISFILNTGTPAVYQATVLMSIGSYIDSSNPQLGEMMIAQQLVSTYITILGTREVREGTVQQLGLQGFPPEALAGIVQARPIEGTSLFRINVSYTDPVLAADIANAIADQLIEKAPGLAPTEQERLQSLRAELAQLRAMSTEFENQRVTIAERLDASTDPVERAQLQEQINNLRVQIRETSSTMIGYTRSIDELELRSNRLQKLEAARVPTSSSSVNLISASLVGATVGALIALAAVIALEYLDDVVRSSEIAVQTLGLPVLGGIMRIGKRTDNYTERLVYNFPSMSPIAEGYRTLRTNLLFSSGNTNKGVYIITSPSPEEGKSMTTSNLAITMALAGLQVLLIDADLRRPKLHEVFDLENNVGLTTLLFADPGSIEETADESRLPANLRQCLQNTSVPRLRVITSGFIPSNPTEILGSALMQRWIEAFRASSNIDIVLIDSPPSLMVADATVLAATTKGDVLLVLDASKTRRIAAIKAKERFDQLGIELKGIILNRINPRDETYEYTYSYGYYYTPTGRPTTRTQANGGSRRQAQAAPRDVQEPETSNEN